VKKKIGIFLGIAAILIGVVVYSLLTKEYFSEVVQKPRNTLDLKQFSEIMKKKHWLQTEIFYIPFSTEVTDTLLTEGHILHIPSVKLTFMGSRICFQRHIGDVLSNSSFSEQQSPPQYKDFRYCCLMESASNKYIRFSISKTNFETIFINGEPYEASPELIDAFLKLLPVREYEKAAKYIQEKRAAGK